MIRQWDQNEPQLRNILTQGKGKAIPLTSRGWPKGCETSRLPHFLDSRLTDGGGVVSLTRQPAAIYPHDNSWYSFLFEAESTPRPQCVSKD
jgi:hypothetical protein